MTAQQPQREYIITEFQLKQLQDFASLEFVCRAIRTRPHTPQAPGVTEERASCNNCYDTKCGYACDIPCGNWKLRPYPIQIQELKAKINALEQETLSLLIERMNTTRAATLAERSSLTLEIDTRKWWDIDEPPKYGNTREERNAWVKGRFDGMNEVRAFVNDETLRIGKKK